MIQQAVQQGCGRVFLLIVMLGALASGGCVGFPPLFAASAGLSAVQAGTSAYIGGELESSEVVEMNTLFQIVQEVMVEELGFEITRARTGDNLAYIQTRETQGRRIRITLERKSPIVTKFNIRVGLFGDQSMSRLILGAIQSRLPAPPQRTLPLEDVLRALEALEGEGAERAR
jgi:hypothetical protein